MVLLEKTMCYDIGSWKVLCFYAIIKLKIIVINDDGF